MSLITHQQLRAIFPKIDPIYAPLIDETMVKYSMTTKIRKAAFLAQAGHESVNFMRFEENLNYSAQGLLVTFHKYFKSLDQAAGYARQPQKIANYVYANRMGNGGPASGDGWNFRGRGAIQLTGKDTYGEFGQAMGLKTLRETIDFLSTPRGQIISAGWFWNTRKLNAIADSGDFVLLTKRINGGTNGLDDRQRLYNLALKAL